MPSHWKMKTFTLIHIVTICLLRTVLAVTGPWPNDPNTASDCYSWIRAREGEDCISLASRAHVAVNKFIIWNPSLYIDCDNVIVGNGYCMGSSATALPSSSSTTTSRSTTSSSSSRTTTTSSRTSTTTTTTSTTAFTYPTPSSGTAPNCITLAYFRSTDTCDIFVSRYASTGLTKANLILWNTLLLSDCSGLSDIRLHNVCIAIDPTITTTTTTTTTTTPVTYPTPSSGTAPNCITFAYFRSTDTCDIFVTRYASTGLTKANLILWNTLLLSDCSGLSDIRLHNVCIAIDPTITTTTTSRTSTSSTSTVSTPSPLMPGGCVSNCDMWYKTPIGGYDCGTTISIVGNFRGVVPGLTIADLKVFNPGIAPYCDDNLVLPYETYICIHTPGWQPQSSTTTSSTTPSIVTPLPTQSGMVAGCTFFHRIEFAEFCDAVVELLIDDFPDLTVSKLIYWNPAVGSDCDLIQQGTYLCVQGPAPPVSSTTSSRTTTTSTTAFTYPTPSSGTAPNCIKLAYFRSTDTCDTFVSRYATSDGLTKANLILWNTLLLSDCSGLSDIRLHNVCIAVATPTTTTSTTAFTYPTPSSGTAPNCIKLAYFRSTDTCDTFVTRYATSDGLTKANLILWNTLLLSDCSGLSDIRLHNVCIAVSTISSITSSRTTTTSSRTTTTTSRTTTTTSATFTGNPASFTSASTPVCVPTTTTPAPAKVTGGATLNTAITTACQQLLGSSGSFFMDVGLPYKTTVVVGGHLTQFLIQIKLGGFSVTQSLCITQFQSINTKCTSGSPALTPGGCFYTSDANMQCCIFT